MLRPAAPAVAPAGLQAAPRRDARPQCCRRAAPGFARAQPRSPRAAPLARRPWLPRRGRDSPARLEAAAAAAAAAPGMVNAPAAALPRLTRLASEPLASGTLHTCQIGPLQLAAADGRNARVETRTVRCWIPDGTASTSELNVLYLHDGQNLFQDGAAFGGASWRAAEAAASCVASGGAPPFAIVGIDHAGPLRSLDFLPVAPGTGVGDFRADAAAWPGGGVEAYLDALADVILPAVQAEFSLTADPARCALGGSSFGGIATLHALVTAHRLSACFSAALVESPSLWIDSGRYLQQVLLPCANPRLSGAPAAAPARWPERLYLAMGMREHSGSRPGSGGLGAAADAQHACSASLLAAALGVGGLDSQRLLFLLEPGAAHTERDWGRRLPRALRFLMGTMPGERRVAAQQAAALEEDDELEAALAALPMPLRAVLAMPVRAQPRSSSPPRGEASAEAAVRAVETRALEAAAQAATEADVAKTKAAVAAAADQASVQAAAAAAAHAAAQAETQADAAAAEQARAAAEAHAVARDADEMRAKTALLAEAQLKSKAAKVAAMAAAKPGAAALAAALAAAAAPPDAAAARAAGSALFYFAPAELVAGAPATIFVNRRRSRVAGLADQPALRLHYGFDAWAVSGGDAAALVRAEGLPSGNDADWWVGRIGAVPDTAMEMNFVLSDGDGALWDNADGADYAAPIVRAEDLAAVAPPRQVASAEAHDHAGGTLHILTLAPREGLPAGTAEARAARWQEEKTLRVWTPPGWSLDSAPPGGYPVLYISDAQNLFEDWLAHQGVSWRAAEALSSLINEGALPPMILVGIDAAGAFRCLNFLPFPPGTGAGNFRPECARWPGGGVDAYIRRITTEILPLAERRFGASPARERRAFGGASFGGVAALHAALSYSHVFGGVLAESPSLWVGEGRYLDTLAAHAGPLTERLFLGSGTREYSATRDHDNEEVDALLLHYHQEAARILESKGLSDGRLKFVVDEGGGHHEGAWGWRLSGALMHLFHGR